MFEIEEADGGVPSLDGAVAYLSVSCATGDQLAWLPGLLQGDVEAAKEFISEDDDDRLADRPLFLHRTLHAARPKILSQLFLVAWTATHTYVLDCAK